MASSTTERNAIAWWRRGVLTSTAALAMLLGLVPADAWAALGETRDSVQQDLLALGGTKITIQTSSRYDVHQLVTGGGATVRQYVEKGGTVFAVSWSGRFPPDLRVLLGAHYRQYVAVAKAPHPDHHVLSVTTDSLVLDVVKLPRGFAGHAHLPSLVPPGVGADELR
jgi:hypothetical protein